MKGTRYKTDGRFDRQNVHRLPHSKGTVTTTTATTATAPFLRSTDPKELLAGSKREVGLSFPRVRFGNGVGGRTVLGATRLGSQVDIRISPVPIAGEGTRNACKRLDSTLGVIPSNPVLVGPCGVPQPQNRNPRSAYADPLEVSPEQLPRMQFC